MVRKTLKEGMPVTRKTRKIRVSARVQTHEEKRDVKSIKIEIIVVDKVISNVLVDGGS